MFDIQRKYLEQGLDMFAQFFICPLMLEGAMDRELQAIDSEFSMSQQSDGARKFQVRPPLTNNNQRRCTVCLSDTVQSIHLRVLN
jgi:secreted Zn-dependent insulinase-like peptidase